jgi:hypothetical protein
MRKKMTIPPSYKDKYKCSWKRREMATFLLVLKTDPSVSGYDKRRKEGKHRF